MIHRFALLLFLVAGCPKPSPGVEAGPHPGVVQCGTNAVEKCAPSALPAVNGCLTGRGDITSCLISLIHPAACWTYEVVVCLTRHEGAAAQRAYDLNPQDTRDGWRAQRAKEFLDKQQVQFSD
jgi:hypothetical protein